MRNSSCLSFKLNKKVYFLYEKIDTRTPNKPPHKIMISGNVIKGNILNIQNYYMVAIFFLFSSRKSFVLCSDEKKNSLCLWRYQYRISLWLGPAREFRMASKWFWHLSMPKNNSAKHQFDFFVSYCPDYEAAMKRGHKNLRLWLKKMRVIFEFQFQRCPSAGVGEIHTWNVYWPIV